jgi:hypothetical protein
MPSRASPPLTASPFPPNPGDPLAVQHPRLVEEHFDTDNVEHYLGLSVRMTAPLSIPLYLYWRRT